MAVVELEFASLPVHVRTARLVAAAMGRRLGLTSGLLDEVKLAVGEAASRAVSVHRHHAIEAPVVIWLGDGDGHYTVDVRDAGPPGDEVPPLQAAGEPASVTDLIAASTDSVGKHGGELRAEPDARFSLPASLGLALIQGLVDDVTISLRDDAPGTSVSMRWLLPGDDDEDGNDSDSDEAAELTSASILTAQS